MHAWLDRQTSPPLVRIRQVDGHGDHVRSVMKALHTDLTWDARQRVWSFPFLPSSVFSLTEAASMLSLELRIDQQLEQVRKRVLEANQREEGIRRIIQRYIDDPKLPMAEYTTQQSPPPWQHQQVAYHWAMRTPVLYLGHKMGLGKTRQGADIIRGKWERGEIREPQQILVGQTPSVVDPTKILPEAYATIGGALVVCPRAVMMEWMEQLWRWQGIQALGITSYNAERKRELAGTPAWVHLCGYDSLETIERNTYDFILGDELHFIANDDSNRFQRMMHLRGKARGALGLSGTSQSNGLISLQPQFFWLDGGRTLGPTKEAFRKRFLSKEAKDASGLTSEEMVARAISRIYWPLSMQEAFPGKPQKINKTVRVPMTTDQAAYYEKIRSQAEADILTGKVSLTETMTRITKLMQVTQGFVFDDKKVVQQFSSAKLKALEEMLSKGGDIEGHRVLIWCNFRPEVEMISQMLTRLKLKHLQLHGDVTDAQREDLKWSWANDASYRVVVGMISMGIGLNMHAPKCVDDQGRPAKCFTTVYYGLSYKVTQVEQSMDRVYRGDQTESCLYFYLLSENLDADVKGKKPIVPMDAKIYEALMRKLSGAKAVNESSVEWVRSLLAA
jgi:SNF2 family DNA or RNA helicase